MTALDHFLIWSLIALCVFAAIGIVLVVAESRLPVAVVEPEPEPEPVDEGPVHHASDEMAADHQHHGRHHEDRPVLWGDRLRAYNDRAVNLDEPTGPIVTGEFRVMGESEVPVMGQDPGIALRRLAPGWQQVDPPVVPRWFLAEQVSA
jgi:hypothetical protein